FRKILSRLKNEDPRDNLKRYYDYFLGLLNKEAGKKDFAYDKLAAILTDPRLDKEYEKLLIARIHENCAKIAREKGWQPQLAFHLNELYRIYPQLIPFSQLEMGFRLSLSPELEKSESDDVHRTLKQLKSCYINWNPPEDLNYPEVMLHLEQGNRLVYQVKMNREVVVQGAVDVTQPDAGKILAYRLFKVPGK
ncbi:MAG: hypothetical protein D6748_13880, partial [Calditrichaeota bacterium]